ncbi:MAG: hypothetical protein GWN29_03255 [Gammaproteobacteria bacterium]|nr:hypothetical protein [Gammaproteobacteria bacterium]
MFSQDLRLRASVDRATVRENESLTYILRAEGQTRERPDFASLAVDFDVLETRSSMSVQMAGGQTTTVTEWLMQLMPREAGNFTLPPITLAGSLSNPVDVEVLPALAGDAPADIFLEVEATPQTAYAQAEVIYTVRLFRGVNTGRSSLSEPEVSGGEAIIERLADDREYQVVRDGRPFATLERRYAIFPQSAGPLTIEPVTLDAVVITSSGFRGVQVFSSEAVELEVLDPVPPPQQWAGAAWLPARTLELTERWSADGEPMTAGIPQTRTLIVESEGVQESQLPELAILPADGIRQYPDQPELAREVTQRGLQARRTERYAVIAQAEGRPMLPGLVLPWFDVADGTWKAATLPPRELEILPSAEQPALQPVVDPLAVPADTLQAPSPGIWQAVSAGLFVAWLATLGLWWQSRRPTPAPVASADQPTPRRASNRRLLRQLRAACQANDARRAHALLLEWGALRLPGPEPSSLGAMAQRLPGGFAEAVAELERSLYGPDEGAWNGTALAAELVQVDSVSSSADQRGDDALLPLYR